MAKFKPATISKGSFAFCRTTIAILLWISILLQIKWIVILVFVIMLFSAILKVEKAPLIILYKYTIGKWKVEENIVVDEIGIFVSHTVGAIFSFICVLLIYYSNVYVGWIVTFLFTILQTSAAFGFCSALKLYTCMAGGTCCRIGKRIKKVKNNV